ncbi:hypothetical protein BaRGS_00018214 [Batillaria attramentaria]|uniref:PHD-type domain-containing protein n=1 Tax=Batillaria attramentaria TaxID=370345 RepID=A0ABD0KUB2_9CAEN
MSSEKDYCRSILRVSVAQICQNLGWNATQSSTLELLTDVLERYLQEVGKVSHRYCEQFGRTEPNLDDLGLTFRHLGINLGELEDYVRHVDPVPFAHEVVAFPATKNNNLQFPNPHSREILHHREEHVHEHLPYMFPGMEDEVQATVENTASPALAPQPPVQDVLPMDIGSPVGEKRAAPSAEGAPPSKRPRMTASNLPEEAGHSQYEMTSVTMSNGFLTPTRGKGRLPDARTPPPTIRHALTFADTPVSSNKAVDGSEANKENNAVAPSGKESTVRVVVTAGKEPTIYVTSHDGGGSGDAGGKPEGEKIKPKKKAKDGAKAKKLKKTPNVKISLKVGDKIPPAAAGVEVPAPAKKIKTVKEGKAKAVKLKTKEGKGTKSGKVKTKVAVKKKLLVSPPPASADEVAGESRLKELLLTTQEKPADVERKGPSATASPSKTKRSPSPDSAQILRQAFQPTDIFDSHSSHENSPGQLVIAEAEGRAQEREEERQARLRSIDESISTVIRDSVLEVDQRDKGAESSTSNRPASATGEKKKTKKQKEKVKLKSSEFVHDDVIKREEEEDMTARSEKSMNDTINAVIRKVEQKPFVSDKYSSEELRVYEFGESPPGSPLDVPVRRSSTAGLASPPPVSTSPAAEVVVTSPVDPPIKPLKIEIPKEKEKHKDRDKSRNDIVLFSPPETDTSSVAENPGFKIKIKLGSAGGSSSSVTVTENKASPVDTAVKQETVTSPPRPEIPKLVIRRDAGDGGSSQKKHTSRLAKSTPPTLSSMKMEPSDSPPVLQREVTPPPPILLPSPPFQATASSPRRQRSRSPRHSSPVSSPTEKSTKQSPSKFSFDMRGRSPVKSPTSPVRDPFSSPVGSPVRRRPSHTPPPRTPSPPQKSPSPMPKTPSPLGRVPSSPAFISSPLQRSPSYGHKSPTPTPKTPSLSPAYNQPSPAHSDHSPTRKKSSPPPVIKPLFGTPERESSPPPSPLFASVPEDRVKPEPKPKPPQTTSTKPKGKVGRPRSKSPRATSPRAKLPKGPKSPKAGKSPKARTGKSPGRPPKAKTLAAAAEAPPPKPKPAPKISPPKVTRMESVDEESLPSPSAADDSQPPALELSPSGSPSPALPGGSSRGQRSGVEAETVGFFIDESGQKIWICPACKLQDDGSPMIGCDKCDDWYHWVCVNIVQEPPEDEQWYCPRCNAKARAKPKAFKPKGKRGRKKKNPV